MVSDLSSYKSHPDKALEVHIRGVIKKALKRYDSPIVRWASLFHDLGKINPNFQRKLELGYHGEYCGYDEHAYLSALAWVCFFEKNGKNNEALRQDLGGDIVRLQIVLTLIARHHGNLPNFEILLKEEPLSRLYTFLNSNRGLPLSDFLGGNLNTPHIPFLVQETEFAKRLIAFTHKEDWQRNALDYFLETQYSFAALVEADKRDAGDMYIEDYYHLEATQESCRTVLSESLNQKWLWLSDKKEKSPLDVQRTAIREESVGVLRKELSAGKRVFTLTAPTGAGKTFTLLALAKEIQSQKPNVSILYALPFLSITEQVEKIVMQDLLCNLLSVSSKSRNDNIEVLIQKLDSNPEPEDFKRLLKQDFIQQTFDHPLIVTTFTQLFETLLSNKNATLLKLPNFARRIFLIDEVQALPPRVYIFFAAWLDAFCRKWDSYAILSTATMPKMDFEVKSHIQEKRRPEGLFKYYLPNKPHELLDYEKYFDDECFNRYKICLPNPFEISMVALVGLIEAQEHSSLVILNTIRDARSLFETLSVNNENVYLLNTHFIPSDRRKKIDLIKTRLEQNEKIILVSTQLIEAGVDIDFPIVFRDLCPLPSLIQSAGRCNRNKKRHELGKVWFFHLKNENGKSGATAIYRDESRVFLEFSKKNIFDGIEEKKLLKVQEHYFSVIANDLMIGDYEIENEKVNLIELVNIAAFETLGKFKLINDKKFGYEFQYFIPENDNDNTYDLAVGQMQKAIIANDFQERKHQQIQLNNQLKKVTERTITIRAFDKCNVPAYANCEEYFDIRVLSDLSLYSFEKGFMHDSVQNSFL